MQISICFPGSWLVSLRLETIQRNVEPWLWAGDLWAKLSDLLWPHFDPISASLWSYHWLTLSASLSLWLTQTLDTRMPCKVNFPFEGSITLVALEWSFQSVRLHMTLQDAKTCTSVVALVALERLLCSVHPHHVNFQITSCNARIIAHCASLWLFTRVRLRVGFIFTVIALV